MNKKKISLAFSIDVMSKAPMFEQLCSSIRSAIIQGELSDGAQLPSTRSLAADLGISRTTILTAYDQLCAEGYVKSLQRSGYWVCSVAGTQFEPQKTSKRIFAKEVQKKPSPLLGGQPDMRLFPYRQWGKTVSRVCRTKPEAMLNGIGQFGNYELREAIANHVLEWRGLNASPHQIIITAGATDALGTCFRALVEPKDQIGLEDPGYPPARSIAEAMMLSVVNLRVTEGGAELPSNKQMPKLLVLTPSHQSPLGGSMPPRRRQELLHWAFINRAWIVEDDYDSEFRYAGHPIPSLASCDPHSRTIYIGSFAKIFSNHLRIGYLIVPDELVEKFRVSLELFGFNASHMPQQALADFIQTGAFYHHLRRVRRIYKERRNYLTKKLSLELSEFGRFEDHQAGMHIVFLLEKSIDDVEVSKRAFTRGVEAQPLSMFYASAEKCSGLVLGFCNYTEDEIDYGIAVLKEILESI